MRRRRACRSPSWLCPAARRAGVVALDEILAAEDEASCALGVVSPVQTCLIVEAVLLLVPNELVTVTIRQRHEEFLRGRADGTCGIT